MKAIVQIGLWKAIAFLAAVIFFSFSFLGCCPEDPVSLKPTLVITSIRDVTTSKAVIVASIVPNGEATVSIEYYTTLHPEQKVDSVLSTKYNGTESVSVIIPLTRLEPNATYNVTVTVINAAGSVAKVGTFSTGQLTAAVVIKPATNVTRYEATLNATIVANQPDTKVTFKYWTDAEPTPKAKMLSTLYNGTDSINVSADVNGLTLNTKYYYQAWVKNKAGEVISAISSFETYAVADSDGNLYHTVKIGTQVWLRENFKGTHYANGDPIPNVANAATWANLTTGAYCQYNNDPKIAEVYGNLYNFYVGTDPRGLIIGYHTPSLAEWAVLSNYLGGTNVAGGKMKEAGFAHWIKPNTGATNSSGFTALPGGGYQGDFGNNKFDHLGDGVEFWSTTNFMNMPNVASTASLGETMATLVLNGGSYFYYAYSLRVVKN